METKKLMYEKQSIGILNNQYLIKGGKIHFTSISGPKQMIVINDSQGLKEGVYNIFGLTKDDPEIYPIIKEYNTNALALKIDVKNFINIFTDLKKYCGVDDMRPVMQGIYFD